MASIFRLGAIGWESIRQLAGEDEVPTARAVAAGREYSRAVESYDGRLGTLAGSIHQIRWFLALL